MVLSYSDINDKVRKATFAIDSQTDQNESIKLKDGQIFDNSEPYGSCDICYGITYPIEYNDDQPTAYVCSNCNRYIKIQDLTEDQDLNRKNKAIADKLVLTTKGRKWERDHNTDTEDDNQINTKTITKRDYLSNKSLILDHKEDDNILGSLYEDQSGRYGEFNINNPIYVSSDSDNDINTEIKATSIYESTIQRAGNKKGEINMSSDDYNNLIYQSVSKVMEKLD